MRAHARTLSFLAAGPSLAACDATVHTFDPIPLSAGLLPAGGGTIDDRLAGCELRRRTVGPSYSEVWTVRYDAFGRRLESEWRFDDELQYREVLTYDVFGCPVEAVVDATDDTGDLYTLTYVQACDLFGRVVQWTSEWGTEHARHRYDLAGNPVSIEYAYDDWPAHDRLDLEWQGGRVVTRTWRDPETGDVQSTERATFRLDGWVSAYEYVEDTYALSYDYDLAGRVVRVDDGYRVHTYRYDTVLSPLPSSGAEGADRRDTYASTCFGM